MKGSCVSRDGIFPPQDQSSELFQIRSLTLCNKFVTLWAARSPDRPHLHGSHFSVVTLWVGGLNPGIMLCCCDPGYELYKCRKSAKSLSVHSPPEYSATEETISWTSGGVTGQICTQTSSSTTWWLISQTLALNRFQRLNKCNTIKQSCLLESGWALTVANVLYSCWICEYGAQEIIANFLWSQQSRVVSASLQVWITYLSTENKMNAKWVMLLILNALYEYLYLYDCRTIHLRLCNTKTAISRSTLPPHASKHSASVSQHGVSSVVRAELRLSALHPWAHSLWSPRQQARFPAVTNRWSPLVGGWGAPCSIPMATSSVVSENWQCFCYKYICI